MHGAAVENSTAGEALTKYRFVLGFLEEGNARWPNVPYEDKGVVFKPSFILSVRTELMGRSSNPSFAALALRSIPRRSSGGWLWSSYNAYAEARVKGRRLDCFCGASARRSSSFSSPAADAYPISAGLPPSPGARNFGAFPARLSRELALCSEKAATDPWILAESSSSARSPRKGVRRSWAGSFQSPQGWKGSGTLQPAFLSSSSRALRRGGRARARRHRQAPCRSLERSQLARLPLLLKSSCAC